MLNIENHPTPQPTPIDLLRKSLAQNPNSPQACLDLGNALQSAGQLPEAIECFRRLTSLRPDFAGGFANLGNALHAHGQIHEAIAACRQALALNPDLPEAHNNLGNALLASGQIEPAIASYQNAVTLKPNYPEAHFNLANALSARGRPDAAIAAYRRAIALNPASPETHFHLANSLHTMGQLHEARAAFQQAIALHPDFPEAFCGLGNVLRDLEQLDDAVAAFRQAIALKPDYLAAHSNMGLALQTMGNSDAAIASFQHALAINPDVAEVHCNLGLALQYTGRLDDAIAAYRHAIALKPDLHIAHGNLAFALHYHPDYDPHAIAEELRRWNLQHAAPLKHLIQPHPNDRNPHRRLRIGYVSPDLREHPVGRFLLPLLAHHDKQHFEIFAYAQVPAPDATTQSLRQHIDHWRSIVGLSDTQAADLIRRDHIDILVDLAMHTAGNRLLIFAQKPAPLQLTYLAYCSTTGLDTMDYRLTDPYLDPPGIDDSVYSEQTLRLPETYWCYDPLQNQAQGLQSLGSVGPLPALANGFITFGSLNNFCKNTPASLALWSRVLQAVPHSQLLLYAHEGSHRQWVRDLLANNSVDPQRLTFVARSSPNQYFKLYQTIDIALDPFPFGGGTTSCDALFMGVPVVTLAGHTAVSRGGSSILSNVGLPELVAKNPDEYVTIAANLAHDTKRLAQLHRTLRQRLAQSPLTDAPRFARNIESAYRQIWQKWCTPGATGPRSSRPRA